MRTLSAALVPPVRGFLLAGVAAALLAVLLLPVDHALLRLLHPERTTAFDGLLRFVDGVFPTLLLATALGVGGFLLAAGRTAGLRSSGLLLALGPLIANRLAGVIKDVVARARPQHAEHALDGLRVIVELADRESFPSGHVTSATATALALFLVLPGRWLRALVLGIVPLMWWNRVALAVHFPSDATGGVAVGALSVGLFAALLRGRDVRLPGRWRIPGLLLALLVITAAGKGSTFAHDPVSLEPYPGFTLRPTTLRVVLEPFLGPALELAYAPGARAALLAAGPWAAALVVLAFAFGRGVGFRRRLLRAGLAAAWLGAVAALSLGGRVPADRFHVDEREGLFFDPHVHAGDPVDGALDRDAMIARILARDVEAVAVTNHDALPPTPAVVPGLEWSGDRHPADPSLHLLVYGARPALEKALAHVVPPLEAGRDDGARIALAMVREVKTAGGVVVVAHYWRTRAAMARRGLLAHLPSPEALADAGVDGFEVANRHWDAEEEDRALVRGLDALCRERGLLRLGSSDDHGVPAGSPCITFLPGRFPAEPAARNAAVLERLASRGEALPVVFQRERRATLPPAFLAGPVMAYRYLASLSPRSRLSLAAWIVLWALCARAVSGSPAGSREPAPASSRR